MDRNRTGYVVVIGLGAAMVTSTAILDGGWLAGLHIINPGLFVWHNLHGLWSCPPEPVQPEITEDCC